MPRKPSHVRGVAHRERVPDDAAVSEKLGSYTLVHELGEGGMGQVWLAQRRAPGGFEQKVALKRIHPRYLGDPVVYERFVTEARTNARLAHANIVRVLDFGTEPQPFVAFEYIESVSVHELILRMYQLRQRVDVSAAMFIAVAAAQALGYAHKLRDDDGTPLGIVHRDVTPSNILVSVHGTPYVMDFGLVQVADNLLETHGANPVGTFCYMAPEQLSGGHVDGRADLFSLGVVLWEMLATRQLIPSNVPDEVRAFHARGAPRRPSELNPEVPPDLDELTMQCLRVDPEQRPPSAEAVSVALQRMAHERAPGYGGEQLAKTITWAFPERRWAREPPNLPPLQPDASDRARLAAAKARAPRRGTNAPARGGLSPFGVVALVLLVAIVAVLSFIAGAVWMGWG